MPRTHQTMTDETGLIAEVAGQAEARLRLRLIGWIEPLGYVFPMGDTVHRVRPYPAACRPMTALTAYALGGDVPRSHGSKRPVTMTIEA